MSLQKQESFCHDRKFIAAKLHPVLHLNKNLSGWYKDGLSVELHTCTLPQQNCNCSSRTEATTTMHRMCAWSCHQSFKQVPCTEWSPSTYNCGFNLTLLSSVISVMGGWFLSMFKLHRIVHQFLASILLTDKQMVCRQSKHLIDICTTTDSTDWVLKILPDFHNRKLFSYNLHIILKKKPHT